MSWANVLSMADCNAAVADLYAFDPKTGHAYTMLILRLRKMGSTPFEERSLAAIARCTRHFWTTKAWPALQELFEVRDGRLFHPEVSGLRGQGSYPAEPQTTRDRRSEAGKIAANARWGGRGNLSVVPDSEFGDANGDAIASESHAGNDAISTTSAYVSDAISASDPRSDRIPGASSGPLAPSLSQQRDSISDGSKIERESLGERAPARAGEPMRSDAIPDANGNAIASDSHAATPPAPRVGKPKTIPIPRDWEPSLEGEAAARSRGLDPATVAASFRNWHLGNGLLQADWDARFLIWIEREREQDVSRRQGHMTMPIAGPPLSESDQALRRRLTDVAMMRTRTSMAPLAPPFDRLRDAGPSGAAWLDTIEAWASGGFRGEPPPSFDDFLAAA